MDNLQERIYKEFEGKEIFKQALDNGLDYLNTIFDRNVYPSEEALQGLKNFDEELPEHSTDAKQVLTQLHQYGSPATTATMGGRYFGFVASSVTPIGIAAKNLATFWDQAPAMHVLSPIGCKLEAVVEQWLVNLFNLPKDSCAGFVSGTSTANLCGLAAARYHILKKNNWDVSKKGLRNSPKIRIVTGKQAHATVTKAIGILGLGSDAIEWVDVDQQGRILTESVPELDQNTILILQAGNVNSGAFDNFKELCKKAKAVDAWVHIDGAFGLWAQTVERLKHLTLGMELADSWAVDAHKTLNTPYDNGIVLCANREALISALHMSGSYIVQSDQRDGMLYTPEMSRRARIIELWATLKYLGKSGVDELVHTLYERAKLFADTIRTVDGFNVENDVVFNQVIVRCATDELTEKVLHKIQELRDCWLGGSVWFGKKVMRVSFCSWATTENDITIAVNSFRKALELITSSK